MDQKVNVLKRLKQPGYKTHSCLFRPCIPQYRKPCSVKFSPKLRTLSVPTLINLMRIKKSYLERSKFHIQRDFLFHKNPPWTPLPGDVWTVCPPSKTTLALLKVTDYHVASLFYFRECIGTVHSQGTWRQQSTCQTRKSEAPGNWKFFISMVKATEKARE